MNRRQEYSNDASMTIFAVLAALLIVLLVGGGLLYFRWQRNVVMQQIQMEMAARDAAVQAERQLRELQRLQQETLQQNAEKKSLRILAWNVESGGSDPAVISQQLTDLGKYDIVGLSEVDPANSSQYTDALGEAYESVVSDTGGNDRLVMAYDSNSVSLVDAIALEVSKEVKPGDDNELQRSPLLGRFRINAANDEFQVVLVHLARDSAELRQEQAINLRKWAGEQELPTFAIGHFNFDYDFPTQKGNRAFDEFTKDGIWMWAKPEKLIDTNWSDPDGDGNDNFPDSCLNFMFVNDSAKNRKSESNVIVREGDFPDDEKTSDHRPVELIVELE